MGQFDESVENMTVAANEKVGVRIVFPSECREAAVSDVFRSVGWRFLVDKGTGKRWSRYGVSVIARYLYGRQQSARPTRLLPIRR
jgi:hypothetical protein